MLQTILLVLHVVVAISLIAFILLQQGKGAATGAAFGSGASSTVFGARGSSSFLSRTTSILAIVFFSNCLLLAFLGGQRQGPTSVIEALANEPVPVPDAVDAKPAGNADVPVVPAPATTAASENAATTTPAVPDSAPAPASGAADMPNIPPASTSP
jgi:preprotein translocase subunit SecG